jgi:hypothetical protein
MPGTKISLPGVVVLWTKHSHHRSHRPFHSELVDVILTEWNWWLWSFSSVGTGQSRLVSFLCSSPSFLRARGHVPLRVAFTTVVITVPRVSTSIGSCCSDVLVDVSAIGFRFFLLATAQMVLWNRATAARFGRPARHTSIGYGGTRMTPWRGVCVCGMHVCIRSYSVTTSIVSV